MFLNFNQTFGVLGVMAELKPRQQVYADETEVACERQSCLDGSLLPLPRREYIVCPSQAAQQTQLVCAFAFKAP